jgi:hypothetical protein
VRVANSAEQRITTWSNCGIAGVFLSTSCGVVDAVSFGFAPQSLLAPFGALTLVVSPLPAVCNFSYQTFDPNLHQVNLLVAPVFDREEQLSEG